MKCPTVPVLTFFINNHKLRSTFCSTPSLLPVSLGQQTIYLFKLYCHYAFISAVTEHITKFFFRTVWTLCPSSGLTKCFRFLLLKEEEKNLAHCLQWLLHYLNLKRKKTICPICLTHKKHDNVLIEKIFFFNIHSKNISAFDFGHFW